ncbi:hypothetical protein GF312_07395 [Candidatus Poribacteria bacterium]|nr:hypothetical protein [Candidatus Poribacteria bacterium]
MYLPLLLLYTFSASFSDVTDFDELNKNPWQVRHWADRSFIFLSYGGDWSKNYQRVAHECKVQKLLTPTWEGPDFPHPVESRATEWGWNLRPEGKNRRECYQWMHKHYLSLIGEAQHGGGKIEEGKPFYSLTGHSWYSPHGAQWGCDMIGLETGENIIAMQAQIAFLRGAARQNRIPFYVQPSQWFGGTIPIFQEGEDEYTPHNLDEEKVLEGISKGGIAIPNGGHSPSLLARMWYVGWLSGAAIVCPENCQVNFFNGRPEQNWSQPKDKRISLSPIGKRAQKFMEVTRVHPEIGVPYTPFSIMLDEYCGFNGFPLTQPRPWNVLQPELSDREISLFLDILFPGSMYIDFIPGIDIEQEDRRLVDSPYGDSFDVLLNTAPDEVIQSYPVLFCLGKHEFNPETVDKLRNYVKSGGRLYLTYAHIEQLGSVVESLKSSGFVETFGFNPDELPKKIDIERWYTPAHWGADQATLEKRKRGVELLPYEKSFKDEVRSILLDLYDDYMPVKISGEIQFMLNRTRSGWLIGLINNHGVTKERMTPVKLDLSQKKNVEITLKYGEINGVYEWYLEREIPVDGNKFSMEIPPGEIRIVDLQCGHN